MLNIRYGIIHVRYGITFSKKLFDRNLRYNKFAINECLSFNSQSSIH